MPQKTTVRVPVKKKPLPRAKPKGRYEPVYDLYRDGLTQGSISRFLDCREQFRLGTVFGLKPKVRSGATAFGSAFHDVLAAIQHSNDGKKLLTLDQAIDRYYKSQTVGMNLTAVQTEEVTINLALVRVFIERYLKRWEKEDSKLKWIEREKTFNRTVAANGKFISLKGRRDGVFRNPDGLWLHETKTKGRIDEEGLPASLPFDTQTMAYCMSVQEDYGELPHGTLYDVIRTTSLQMRKGRGKAAVPETPSDYVKRVSDDLGERQDWYFIRWRVSITQKDLDVWQERFLMPVLAMIVKWWESVKDDLQNPWKSPLHFLRPGAFWTVYGRTDLFHALTKGQYFDLEQSKVVYPELID